MQGVVRMRNHGGQVVRSSEPFQATHRIQHECEGAEVANETVSAQCTCRRNFLTSVSHTSRLFEHSEDWARFATFVRARSPLFTSAAARHREAAPEVSVLPSFESPHRQGAGHQR